MVLQGHIQLSHVLALEEAVLRGLVSGLGRAYDSEKVMRKIIGILFCCISGVTQAQTCGIIPLDFESNTFRIALDNNDSGVIVGSRSPDFRDDPADALVWQNGILTVLPGLGGEREGASAINNKGQIVGYADDANAVSHPVIWEGGVITTLPALAPSAARPYTEAADINDHGVAVGWGYAADGRQHAVRWLNGKIRDLNIILGSDSSVAVAINNKGQIIGNALSTDPSRSGAFLLEAGTVQFLGTLGGAFTNPADINDRGQIVGTSRTKDNLGRAFLWENGVMKDLGAFGGGESAATGINIHGQVVGASRNPNGLFRAFSWTNGVMTRIGTLPNERLAVGSHSSATKINAKGQVLAYTEFFNAGDFGWSRPWRWKRKC